MLSFFWEYQIYALRRRDSQRRYRGVRFGGPVG